MPPSEHQQTRARASTSKAPASQQEPAAATGRKARAQALAVAGAQIVWTLPTDGMPTPDDVSAEWCAYTGQSREQAAGLGSLAAVHPDDLPTNLAVIEQARAEPRPYQVQCRIRRRDGVYESFLLCGTPLWTSDGQLRQWVGTLTNLSAYEEAQRERAVLLDQEATLSQAAVRAARRAQVAEERFWRLVDANVIGILLADSERITEANDAFLQMVGYTRTDLEAGGICWRTITPPEYTPLDERALAELLERGECSPYEKEYVRKDGRSHVPILIGAALLEREPPRWVCFVVDQTERKRLERENTERAALLGTIIEAMTDGVVVYGPDGDIRMMNAACRQLLGLDEVLQHRSIAERGHVLMPRHPVTREPLASEELPGTRILRGEALTGSQSVDVLMRHARDGHAILVNYAGAPIQDEQGHIMGAVMVLRDVAERRQIEGMLADRAAELEATNQRLDDFLHVVTHELRTPLTSLKANLQLAARRLHRVLPATEPAESAKILMPVRDLLQRSDQQADQLGRLLDDLADASRVRTGKLELHPAACDLAAVVRTAVEEQRRVTKRTIRLNVPAGDAVSVVADAARIEQVLSNYLTNAAKYSPPETPIAVTLTFTDGGARVARLAVRDQGKGLTLEEQQRVWERLQQVDHIQPEGGPVDGGAGLGLGLYISRSIVEGHGGTVGVESVVGEGSTFWFTLPLA